MIKATTIITIISPVKDLVEKSLEGANQGLEKLYKVNDIHLLPAEFNETIKKYEGHLELDLSFKNINEIFNFIYDFSPASFEIYEPGDLNIPIADINSELNTLVGNMLNLTNSRLKLELNFKKFCISLYDVLNNSKGNDKDKLVEVEKELQKWYIPARKK